MFRIKASRQITHRPSNRSFGIEASSLAMLSTKRPSYCYLSKLANELDDQMSQLSGAVCRKKSHDGRASNGGIHARERADSVMARSLAPQTGRIHLNRPSTHDEDLSAGGEADHTIPTSPTTGSIFQNHRLSFASPRRLSWASWIEDSARELNASQVAFSEAICKSTSWCFASGILLPRTSSHFWGPLRTAPRDDLRIGQAA